MARASSTDREALVDEFNQLIAEHQGTVFRMIARMVRDPQKVEDLAQEVFLRVFRGLAHFRGQSEIKTWLYRIIYNVVTDDYRKSKNQPQAVSLDDEDTSFQVADSSESILQRIERRELGEKVRSGLEELSPQFRMVLILFYVEEKRYNEIAGIMGLPVGTVKTYMHRGRGALRKILLQGRGKTRATEIRPRKTIL